MNVLTRFFPLVVGSLFVSNLALAAEQKLVFNMESTKSRGLSNHTCETVCKTSHNNDENVSVLLENGWRVVSSSPKEIIGEEYKTVRTLVKGCTCVGTQYILQKDDPVPTPVPKVETPNKELELLKQEIEKEEIELLKRENALLKQENETLKNKLKAKQKKK